MDCQIVQPSHFPTWGPRAPARPLVLGLCCCSPPFIITPNFGALFNSVPASHVHSRRDCLFLSPQETLWSEDSGAMVSGQGPSAGLGLLAVQVCKGPSWELLMHSHCLTRGSGGDGSEFLLQFELTDIQLLFRRCQPSPGFIFSDPRHGLFFHNR